MRSASTRKNSSAAQAGSPIRDADAGFAVRQPVGRQVVAVGGVQEAAVEEGDDAGVRGRADQPAGGLHHPGHAGHHEGVLEAARRSAPRSTRWSSCCSSVNAGQAGADYRHRLQHLAGVVDALGEGAARHRHQQHVAEDGAGAGVWRMASRSRSPSAWRCTSTRLPRRRRRPVTSARNCVAGEERQAVAGHRVGEGGQALGDAAVVGRPLLPGGGGDGGVDHHPAVGGREGVR